MCVATAAAGHPAVVAVRPALMLPAPAQHALSTPSAAMQGALVLRVPTLWSCSCVHLLCLAIPVPRDSVCGDTGHSVDNSVQYCVSLPVNEFIKFKMLYDTLHTLSSLFRH